jgi:hypothetical protein
MKALLQESIIHLNALPIVRVCLTPLRDLMKTVSQRIG